MAKTYDFTKGSGYVDAHDDLKIWERTFVLSPERWRTAKNAIKLKWEWVPFSPASKPSIPQKRGIYAFIVEYCGAYFPVHGYIMYVGITGDRSSTRNLQVRFGEYLREASAGGRSKVVVMLNKFKDDVYFHFAPVASRGKSLKAVEDEMLAAIIPPCNEAFVAEIAPAVKALR